MEDLANTCRFRDCKHEGEPGCAVRSAIDNGTIPVERLLSYKKLQRELAYVMRKQNIILARAERDRWKKVSKQHKKCKKPKGLFLWFFCICKFYNNVIRIYRQKKLICLNFTKCSSKQVIKIETKEWNIFKISSI